VFDDGAWLENSYRQNAYDVHTQTHSLVMLFTDGQGWPDIEISKESAWDLLQSQAMPLMNSILKEFYPPGGTIVRAMAAKLLAGGIPFRVFVDITLPIISPAMLSGWLLAFTFSLDDLVIASFASGAGSNTLPMVIFSKVKLGVTPDINALATLIILVVSIGIAIAGWIMFKQNKSLSQQNT
jgi:hypothetical protein